MFAAVISAGSDILNFLRDANNRDLLKFCGSALVGLAVVGRTIARWRRRRTREPIPAQGGPRFGTDAAASSPALARTRTEFVRTPLASNREAPAWMRDINDRMEADATIIRCVESPPIIHMTASLAVDGKTEALARNEREAIHARAVADEPHALLSDEQVNWPDEVIALRCESAPFSVITALRKQKRAVPYILSAGALVCCAERGVVYLHRRSGPPATEYFSLHLHTFGGHFHASASSAVVYDLNLHETAKREVREQLHHNDLMIPEGIPALLSFEHGRDVPKGYLQYYYLGINLPAAADDVVQYNQRLHPPVEGAIERLAFPGQLEDRLLDEDEAWVPSGKMQVLAWLAMGAPVFGEAPGAFDTAEAKRIFKNWLRMRR
jgi:hypothetical protein